MNFESKSKHSNLKNPDLSLQDVSELGDLEQTFDYDEFRKQILSSEYGIKFLQEKKRRLELEEIIFQIRKTEKILGRGDINKISTEDYMWSFRRNFK